MADFVWADLSTYDPEKSKRFYEAVFGWRFHAADGYFVAHQGSKEVIGLYETPEFFKKLKMPSFWMSYIAVDDSLKTAEIANEFPNAKVELASEFYGGQIALIRDPQGAGFTTYDGDQLNSRSPNRNCLCWNELHVSTADEVIPFYERLFDWTIKKSPTKDQFNIHDSNQKHVADILEIPNEAKGKYEYWVCTFAVNNMAVTRRKIESLGGGVIVDEGHRIMMHDDSGEGFFYIQG